MIKENNYRSVEFETARVRLPVGASRADTTRVLLSMILGLRVNGLIRDDMWMEIYLPDAIRIDGAASVFDLENGSARYVQGFGGHQVVNAWGSRYAPLESTCVTTDRHANACKRGKAG